MNNNNDDNYEFVISNSNNNQRHDETPSEIICGEKNNSQKNTKKRKVSDIEKKLWETAKKYKTLLDKGEVPQIEESEEDRKNVEDAYQELSTDQHWQLDARVYQSFTKMQRTRDTKIALEGTTEIERLRMIAWEVKTRLQPVIFFAGFSTIETDIFHMHDGNNVRIIEGDNKELLIEDEVIEGKGIAILDDLPLRKLSKEQKLKLKQEILDKFSGKIFTKQELNENFDSIYADLISLMTREREIVLLKVEGMKYRIVPIEEIEKSFDFEQLESQSLAITPTKKVK